MGFGFTDGSISIQYQYSVLSTHTENSTAHFSHAIAFPSYLTMTLSPILPFELIELIIDETVSSDTQGDDRHQRHLLSTLALVNAHFRHRANTIRFRTISFSYFIKVEDLEHMIAFGHLLEADGRVWDASARGIAQHIVHCMARITGYELTQVLRALHNGTLVQIMRRAFRSSPSGKSPTREWGRFSLTCSAQQEHSGPFFGIDWRDLTQEFRDAFEEMCMVGLVGELSLGGLRHFPAELICESGISVLHLECMSFQAIGQGLTLARPENLESLTMKGVHVAIPLSILGEITSVAVHPLEGDEDLLKLVDVIKRIPRLEILKLLCLGTPPLTVQYPGLTFHADPLIQKFVLKELETIKDNLPHLLALKLGIDIWTEYNAFDEVVLPTTFILGPNTPPSVKYIEIDLAFYLFFSQPKSELIDSLRILLQMCSFARLDHDLAFSPLYAPALQRISIRVSLMQRPGPSGDVGYADMDGYEEDAWHVVSAFFPEVMALERIKVDITATHSSGVWRPYRRLEQVE